MVLKAPLRMSQESAIFGLDMEEITAMTEQRNFSTIRIVYSSVDGARITKQFKTVAGAKAFASKMIGNHPDVGSGYAISDDGVGKIVVTGITLAELFPSEERGAVSPCHCEVSRVYGGDCIHTLANEERLIESFEAQSEPLVYRSAGCRCSDHQLVQVGCACGASVF